MRRPSISLLGCSLLVCGVVLPVYAQNSDDRAFVVSKLEARLASLSPGACDRRFAEATGKTLGWLNEADKAGARRELAYEQMMAAPLGHGLVDYYSNKVNGAAREEKRATQQAESAAREISAARDQTIHCLARISQLRAELQGILADPVKLDQAVEQFRSTRE